MKRHGGRARRPDPRRWLSTMRNRRSARVSERVRRPQPLLKQRMPSGRGAMEQPNITSGGAGVLTPRFWLMVVLTGVAAGLMMAILFNVQYAAFGYHEGSLQYGTEAEARAAGKVTGQPPGDLACHALMAGLYHDAADPGGAAVAPRPRLAGPRRGRPAAPQWPWRPRVRREQGRCQAGAGKNGCGVPVAR